MMNTGLTVTASLVRCGEHPGLGLSEDTSFAKGGARVGANHLPQDPCSPAPACSMAGTPDHLEERLKENLEKVLSGGGGGWGCPRHRQVTWRPGPCSLAPEGPPSPDMWMSQGGNRFQPNDDNEGVCGKKQSISHGHCSNPRTS